MGKFGRRETEEENLSRKKDECKSTVKLNDLTAKAGRGCGCGCGGGGSGGGQGPSTKTAPRSDVVLFNNASFCRTRLSLFLSLSANRSPEENDAVRESTIGLTDCSPAAIGMELNANRKRRGRSVRAPFDNNSWPRRRQAAPRCT